MEVNHCEVLKIHMVLNLSSSSFFFFLKIVVVTCNPLIIFPQTFCNHYEFFRGHRSPETKLRWSASIVWWSLEVGDGQRRQVGCCQRLARRRVKEALSIDCEDKKVILSLNWTSR